MMPARTFNVVDRRCRGFGALPPPLAGEGWERGDCAFRRTHMPPPCPSPASGGGDAGADGAVLPKALA
jgi:hypothetical protein